MKKKIFSGIIMSMCLLNISVFAQILPDFPMSVWGTVKDGLTPLASGTVEVYSGTTKMGEIAILGGQYGGNTAFDSKITLNTFLSNLSYRVITGGLTYHLDASHITRTDSPVCPVTTNITFISDVCRYDLNIDALLPTCTPNSVSNGSVDSTTCIITCDAGYVLSGTSCTIIPVATPDSGTYTGAQTVTLLAAGATSIRYTTNGIDPTCSSTLYTVPITISNTTNLRAIACYPNNDASGVANFNYTISTSSGGSGGGRKGRILAPTPSHVTSPVINPVPLPSAPTGFTDITTTFAKDDIELFVSRGVISGYDDGTFRPENPITRAEFLSITMKSLNIATDASETLFQDIPAEGQWMISFVEKARELGIVRGQTIDGLLSFRPNDFITRAEAIAILLNAANISVNTSLTTTFFKDVSVNWMIPYVETARLLGIINGQTINGLLSFRPNDSITRAESVKIIKIASSL